MCGIAGMVSEGCAEVFLDAGQRMVVSIAHRGPDSHGVQCIGSCLLANTRLAIIDLSERGHQPMCNDDQSVWITYNGESYNAAEMRCQLEARGYRFRSVSDTEVMLRLYEECGRASGACSCCNDGVKECKSARNRER